MSEEISNCLLTDNFKYQELFIGENKYLIGVRKVNNLRQVLLTDLKEFYEENLSKEDIHKRCEDLNPVLMDFNFEEIIDDVLLNIPKYTISATLDRIGLESTIEDGHFWFHISFTKCNPENFYDNFMGCLYFSFSELYHRYNCLLDIVKRKDEEISEYKTQGAEILRKSLITEPFDENLFRTKLKNTRPSDKINIFMDTMNFYDSIKDLLRSNASIKEEPSIIESASATSDSTSQKNPVKTEKSVKRPSSSDVRCATITKIEKKSKVGKQNPNFKYL